MNLFANILTFNRINYVKNLIPQVSEFCDKVVVVDSFSTDGTYEWMKKHIKDFNIDLYQNKWIGYGEQRQFCLDKTPIDSWILRIDSDEIPSLGMRKYVRDFLELIHLEKNKSLGFYIPIYTLYKELYLYSPSLFGAEIRLWYNNGKTYWTKGIHELIVGDIPQKVLPKFIALINLERMDSEMVRKKKNEYKNLNVFVRDYDEKVILKEIPECLTFDLSRDILIKFNKFKELQI